MNKCSKKILMVFFASGMLNACANSIENIEAATHQGYCSEDHILPLTLDECEKKMYLELNGKPEKTESEKIMDEVNKAMNEKNQKVNNRNNCNNNKKQSHELSLKNNTDFQSA